MHVFSLNTIPVSRSRIDLKELCFFLHFGHKINWFVHCHNSCSARVYYSRTVSDRTKIQFRKCPRYGSFKKHNFIKFEMGGQSSQNSQHVFVLYQIRLIWLLLKNEISWIKSHTMSIGLFFHYWCWLKYCLDKICSKNLNFFNPAILTNRSLWTYNKFSSFTLNINGGLFSIKPKHSPWYALVIVV